LAALTTADAGEYRLRVWNQCGVATNTTPSRIVVHDKPTITVFDSTRQDRCPGDSVSFSVTAISPLPMRFQWLKNGANLPGETGSILTLQNMKHEDTGDYQVAISNDCGTTIIAIVHLQVGVTISVHPATHVAPVCGDTGFSVQADGVGTLRYQWRLDGDPLTNNVYFSGTTRTNLRVEPLLYTHQGKYDVVITDDCGAAHSVTSKVATLTILPGPSGSCVAGGPPARFHHSMVYDGQREVTVLFGGQTNWSGTFHSTISGNGTATAGSCEWKTPLQTDG
jgi:hypothetical protein